MSTTGYTYVSILTAVGAAQLAAAIERGSLVTWTTMSFGDGGGDTVSPADDVTALVNTVYTAEINTLEVDDDDDSQVIVEAIIPNEEGGWTLREFGIFDSNNNLVVYGTLPEIVKPVLDVDGTDVSLTVKVVVKVGTDATPYITLSNSGEIITKESLAKYLAKLTLTGDTTGTATVDTDTLEAVITTVTEMATQLRTARTLQTNLASTASASFDGTANASIGVSGILPVANGGTGNALGRAAYLGSTTIGGPAQGIYLNAGTPTKLSDTVGTTATPVYLNSGVITACSSDVGSDTHPVYMSGGKITAGTTTVGDSTTPVYLKRGVITASTTTVGSGKQPIYLDSGTITASATSVGDSTTPVYLDSGVLTACGTFITSSIADATYASIGHVTFDNGFTLAWGQGSITGDGGSTSVTYSVAFSSVYQCLWCDNGTTSDLSLSSFTTTQIKMTATENTAFRFLIIGKV